ncbi:MAG: acyl-CoA dehydratase activase [Clostridiales bacterium]|nr:acyl-CoA dehydratase activase [Clostridiales bacterium]
MGVMNTVNEEIKRVFAEYRLGIDVGSTTVKVVITDGASGELLYTRYERHGAKQTETVISMLSDANEFCRGKSVRAAVCGSGGKPIAEALGVHFIQEVVANASAVCRLYPNVRTAIELGGQDAKVIFFHKDEKTGRLQTTDMRMNGSCAGGTGAFIDEMASLLHISTPEFESLAREGKAAYDISGRCGVFAKTDIQPLLIEGAPHEDIARSVFHAIAKQTIGGLSQGLILKPPVIFEGGPLTFNPTLVDVFAERLSLSEDEIIKPVHPETIVAYGAAVAVDEIFPDAAEDEFVTIDELLERIVKNKVKASEKKHGKPFFDGEDDKKEFMERHDAELMTLEEANPDGDGRLRVYLGIDSGSTTSKFVLVDENERVVDRFYSNNRGEPLAVVRDGLTEMRQRYRSRGIELEIVGLGTTGYGESLFAKAFGADFHIVETVSHAEGCKKFFPDVSFVLDIGGQDMKAIWIDDGVVTNIMLNEACSSGCGSFLENFAASLGIPTENIADAAFKSEDPAILGSRCTVFMNSTIINEQREGKLPEDIMAGLCRSIIENVFTKVVRITNTDSLGDKIVVQGGTFKNRAVLCALEEYLGHKVTLAPYPGEMGAYGAAILTKRHIDEVGYANGVSTSFIGLDAVADFTYETMTGVRCRKCANQCSRTVMKFGNGGVWVTGNRCERGEFVSRQELGEEDNDEKTPEIVTQNAPDIFEEREKLLFRIYPCRTVSEKKNITVGIPRVLEFWDSMPFWTTFFTSLGYDVKLSKKSTRGMYERGLTYVASDTICFPAKLAHGHIDDLSKRGVDRIFMPYVMHMPPEGTDKLSPYVCSVLQGYPLVVKNSQSPEERYGVTFDTPIFHWFIEKDRRRQICEYAVKTLGVSKKEASDAFAEAHAAEEEFRKTLRERTSEVIADAEKRGEFVIVLAGRPYHTDPFVSHGISKLFTSKGIAVVPVDGLSGLEKVDLSRTRIEITNDFHTRMLAGAVIAASTKSLEYVQLVSFGCGHDAVLSDEIIRIMNGDGSAERKPPLILKIDESDSSGSLKIRVSSFIETVRIRRKLKEKKPEGTNSEGSYAIPIPSPVKFYKKDKKVRTLIIPNISEEVSILLGAILEKENFRIKTVPVGGTNEIKLGKKYVHNDICFPAQMVIGELIGELQRGNYNHDEVAVGMAKFQCDCRMSHYAGLLRKGLDAAGFSDVPIVTTDAGDTKEMHPGVMFFEIGPVIEAVWAFMMLDILSGLCRKIRPYEINAGETDRVYRSCIQKIADASRIGLSEIRRAFERAIDDMAKIPYDRSVLRPRVFVTGELLVTFHPGSNFGIERYLEKNGMEAVFPRLMDQFRKDFQVSIREIKDYHANIAPYSFLLDYLMKAVDEKLEKTALRHPLYTRAATTRELYAGVRDVIPETLSCGEGWLMAGEIAHFAKEGVKSFVILQPFGCLPNHICGRGVIKRLKDEYEDISILPLDLDPDTSFANVENRLQMLMMNANASAAEEDNSSDKKEARAS